MGVAVFIMGNNRVDKTTRSVGIGLMALACLMLLVSWLVETSKEKCIRRTRELVAAVEQRDFAKVGTLITPRITVKIVTGGNVYNNKEQMLRGLEDGVNKFDVKSARILSIEAIDHVDFIRVPITVYTEQSNAFMPAMTTSWHIDWQEMKDGWQVAELTAVKIGTLGAEQMQSQFPKVR